MFSYFPIVLAFLAVVSIFTIFSSERIRRIDDMGIAGALGLLTFSMDLFFVPLIFVWGMSKMLGWGHLFSCLWLGIYICGLGVFRTIGDANVSSANYRKTEDDFVGWPGTYYRISILVLLASVWIFFIK